MPILQLGHQLRPVLLGQQSTTGKLSEVAGILHEDFRYGWPVGSGNLEGRSCFELLFRVKAASCSVNVDANVLVWDGFAVSDQDVLQNVLAQLSQITTKYNEMPSPSKQVPSLMIIHIWTLPTSLRQNVKHSGPTSYAELTRPPIVS